MVDESFFQSQVDLIREVFMYAHRFRGKRFVLQIGSNLVEDERFPTLIRDLAILHKTGIKLVLVPGAGRRIDEVLTQYAIDTQRVKGIRISSPEAMPLIKMAAFDVANMVMTQLSTHQVDAVIGNWVRGRAIGVKDGIDFQNAGTAAKINIPLLNKVLDEGLVPILPCIGWSGSGTPYNISSLELASLLAEQLEAEKLFFIADSISLPEENFLLPSEGIITREGHVTRLSAAAAERFVQMNREKVASRDEVWSGDGFILELLRLAAHAAQAGVDRIHMINGRLDGVILKEIFSTLGQGTMVHADPFDSIRPMRSGDVAEVLRIMEPNIAKGMLIRRDENDLLQTYKDYSVYETDGTIRGCAALHPFGKDEGEIAGLAVDPDFSHLGIGQKLVRFLIDKAKQNSFKMLFLLTTQSPDFFEQLGFQKADQSRLPEEKRRRYNPDRKSRVYILPLLTDGKPTPIVI